MLRRLFRISLALVVLLSGEVWALGLGEIRLDSALNEPLRAEIELLSATPEELSNLKISLASTETFERYGIDRPAYLQDVDFQVFASGRTDGNVVEVRSSQPMIEPFLTFLVEVSWARGRLLREYTVLLDPPTFAPPAATQAPPVVAAPTRKTPTDSGRIERAEPAPQPRAQRRQEPVQAPRVTAATPSPQPVVDDSPYDMTSGGEVYVERGDTLWGIAQQVRPDSRLSMNQTMLAIFEANPDAFGGNINMIQAGSTLRIPSADEIIRISRGDALSEVARQHSAWDSGDVSVADQTTSRPNLQLVPPDEDYFGDEDLGDDAGFGDESLAREQEIEQRINELEAADIPQQRSLIEIRDNELAALREELARIRGEVYEPPIDDMVDAAALDDPYADVSPEDGESAADEIETIIEDSEPVAEPDADDAEAVTEPVARPVPTRRRSEPTLLDQALGILTNFWTLLIAALLVVGGILFWFMRRRGGAGYDEETWQGLDVDDAPEADLSATETLHAPTSRDESFVVVEQPSSSGPNFEQTVGIATPDFAEADTDKPGDDFGSLEDTFSSETAVNLDQSDPIAEADFHMAYGLYDQAADLVNGALEIEPGREDLLTKLCEIYFVWGNRDAFVDAASRLKATVGDGESADWDKIVIMGQQIAGDDDLFAGAGVAEATKVVDLSFEPGMDETGALDMELIADSESMGDIVDLGGDLEATAAVEADEPMDLDLSGDESDAAPEDSVVDIDFSDEEAKAVSESSVVDIDLSGEETEAALASSVVDIDFSDEETEAALEPSVVEIDFSDEETKAAPESSVVDIDFSDEETKAAPDSSVVDIDFSDEETEAALEESAGDIDPSEEEAEADSEASVVSFEPDKDVEASDDEPTAEMPASEEDDFDTTAEMPAPDATVEAPTVEQQVTGFDTTSESPPPDATVEAPTVEQQVTDFGSTSELPSLDEAAAETVDDLAPPADETEEINLDDLGLDVDDLDETEDAAFEDPDSTSETEALSEPGFDTDLEDPDDITGKNPEVDPNATGVQTILRAEDIGISDAVAETDADIDAGIFDATGVTQVISDDDAVAAGIDADAGLTDDDVTLLAGLDDEGDDASLDDEQATMLASLDDDDAAEDYDFAKTEALPADVFAGDLSSSEETGELPAVASTDLDLDLDDLTAALQVSEMGDMAEDLRDDATLEQPRPPIPPDDADESPTMSIGPEDMIADLHEARTMTEVGTKLDLARAYVDMGDPDGARSILEEVLDEGDEGQRQQAQQLLDSLPA